MTIERAPIFVGRLNFMRFFVMRKKSLMPNHHVHCSKNGDVEEDVFSPDISINTKMRALVITATMVHGLGDKSGLYLREMSTCEVSVWLNEARLSLVQFFTIVKSLREGRRRYFC